MLFEVHLTEEEKLEVLLLALIFFLFASVVSICLAVAICPVNRWLLKRAKQRFLQQQQQHTTYIHQSHRYPPLAQHYPNARHHNLIVGQPRHYQLNQRLCQANFKNSLANHLSGPPPAYEVALRATRLQSLLATSAPPYTPAPGDAKNTTKTPGSAASTEEAYSASKEQLDFGDYFHQPKEPIQGATSEGGASIHISLPGSAQLAAGNNKQAPIMLRLWVKVLEPGELVSRVKRFESKETKDQSQYSTIRKLSLSRQLSIPQLFGSLVNTLSSPLGSNTNTNTSQEDSTPAQPAAAAAAAVAPPTVPASESRRSTLASLAPVMSRVLHMNVASFSYVRDETLISTKKHNQLNFHHFSQSGGLESHHQPEGQEETASTKNNSNKTCQLMISICDIENVLNLSCLNERSCALLANNSAIYIQCELLLPKSKSSVRILNPLKAFHFNGNSNNSDDQQIKRHTVNFSSTISAAAVERPPVTVVVPIGALASSNQADELADESLVSSKSPSLTTSSSLAASEHSSSSNATTTTTTQPASINWRHEPSAEGQSIVVFSSVPKQIAQQQQLTASAQHHQSDLIQFDSVFVSPILNKSTLEAGFIRFRVYSQCKYVNETCLAELKLPLKRLLLSASGDNLADAGSGAYQPQQEQADFILDNLLKNLVTASTGSPLSTLIEQISSEERMAKCDDSAIESQSIGSDGKSLSQDKSSLKSMPSLPWPAVGLASANLGGLAPVAAPGKGLRGSSSFNDSLYRLTNRRQRQDLNGGLENSTTTTTTTNKLHYSVYGNEDSQDGDNFAVDEEEDEANERRDIERRIEENYCRSLMISHWLNYLVAPSYECQPLEQSRGQINLGLSYLPTSNRVIFNAHKASIDENSPAAPANQAIKNLKLQSSTCYLLRFLMVVNGRVAKRKQTPVARKPEWDSQEPITFDMVSVSCEEPAFIVALVMRNTAPISTGSLQNLNSNARDNKQHDQRQWVCNCGYSSDRARQTMRSTDQQRQQHRVVESEPESLRQQQQQQRHCCRQHINLANSQQDRDLVIGHLVLGAKIWREMRSQPRKQIVKQLKLY